MGDSSRKSSTQSVPVMQEMTEEVSHAIAIQAQTATRESLWRSIAHGLAIIIASLSIAGVLSKALFVSQTEYNARLQQDLVTGEAIRQTLSRLDRSITELSAASERMTDTVQALKTDLAVINAVRRK